MRVSFFFCAWRGAAALDPPDAALGGRLMGCRGWDDARLLDVVGRRDAFFLSYLFKIL